MTPARPPKEPPGTRTAATPTAGTRQMVRDLLAAELERLGRPGTEAILCFSDAAWRRAMLAVACPAYAARLASPTARRGTRGKLGMATICHFRHGHAAVVYVRTRGRDWRAIADTVRHEALHVVRPSYSHRQVEKAVRSARRGRPPAPLGGHDTEGGARRA